MSHAVVWVLIMFFPSPSQSSFPSPPAHVYSTREACEAKVLSIGHGNPLQCVRVEVDR